LPTWFGYCKEFKNANVEPTIDKGGIKIKPNAFWAIFNPPPPCAIWLSFI